MKTLVSTSMHVYKDNVGILVEPQQGLLYCAFFLLYKDDISDLLRYKVYSKLILSINVSWNLGHVTVKGILRWHSKYGKREIKIFKIYLYVTIETQK